MTKSITYRALFEALFGHYGPQRWWPGDGPIEVMIGAVLTQHTAWSGAARALDRLRSATRLDPSAVLAMPAEELAELIRPAGYLNVKAKRMQNLLAWCLDSGGTVELAKRRTSELRRRLLGVHGVGPETADAILLYAFGRAVFVVDAYARRLFSRIGRVAESEAYEAIRLSVQREIKAARFLNEFHALIVRHGKDVCRPRPRCDTCVLNAVCRFTRVTAEAG